MATIKPNFENYADRANVHKEELMNIMHELEEAGFIRKAHSLEKIIEKLETWQNNY